MRPRSPARSSWGRAIHSSPAAASCRRRTGPRGFVHPPRSGATGDRRPIAEPAGPGENGRQGRHDVLPSEPLQPIAVAPDVRSGHHARVEGDAANCGSSCARCRTCMRLSSLEAQYLASPRSTILATCSCERAGSASTSGSCHVARPMPIRQNASGSCTSLDVMTMRPPDRRSPFRRSTIRKCARKLTAKASSRPSADDGSPVTIWTPALSASASMGRARAAHDLVARPVDGVEAGQIGVDDGEPLGGTRQRLQRVDPR